ncbi:MAG: SOS response-associated peptidase [Rhodospirillales bacterium]|nr:SOS response-associated peptidase [Rhodospirillales bacterium]
MCSRFENNATFEEVALRFDLGPLSVAAAEFAAMPEIRPTNRVPVIGAGGVLTMLRWGLEVSWDAKPMINARAETLADKQTFRPHLKNRCLIPATAYFEWRTEPHRKIKTRIHLGSDKLFAFAGLYADDRFTIVTCRPSTSIEHIHSRMPVIVAPQNEAQWISPDLKFEEAASALIPLEAGQLAFEDAEPPPRQKDLFGD